jgi:site-specific recombinase XerD
MRLQKAVEEYIEHKRSLGMIFRSQAVILRAFAKAQGDIDIQEVSGHDTRKFLDGNGPVTHSWFGKYGTLRGFYRFSLARHYIVQIPLQSSRPRPPEEFEPYIYTTQDMRRLLDAAQRKREGWLLEPHTLRMLLLLLYGTGLRISEAVRLSLADLDLSAGVFTIRESKFYKSRFVPVGHDLLKALRHYIVLQWPAGAPATTPLLGTGKANRVTRQQAERSFQCLRQEAGVSRLGGARSQPRLHDFRHTFATVRLVTWYREGKNVQRLLPHLSTQSIRVRIDIQYRSGLFHAAWEANVSNARVNPETSRQARAPYMLCENSSPLENCRIAMTMKAAAIVGMITLPIQFAR